MSSSRAGAEDRPGRALGLDLGTVRIGVARSDSNGILALSYSIIERSGSRQDDHARIAALVDELGVELVVVGLPISLDGRAGIAARTIADEVEALRAYLLVPVVVVDERLSSVEATKRRIESATPPRQKGVRLPRRRLVKKRSPIDAAAAAIILQSYLDTRLRDQ